MKRGFSPYLIVFICWTMCLITPKIRAEAENSIVVENNQEIQRVVRLKIEIKTGDEEKILREMGLKCEWGVNEVVCDVTVNLLEKLKQAGLKFETLKEGIRIESEHLNHAEEKGSTGNIYGQNTNNYSIPYHDWNYSPITISSAPAGSYVTSIDVSYSVIHTYVGDLLIKLTDQDSGHEHILWNYEGGSDDNIFDAEFDLTEFNGEWVNQTWKLWGYDCCYGDTGYIDEWAIQIWYELAPDLTVQSLTATNYNPGVGENINVTMVIKNQGNGNASGCLNGLFYNLSSPPTRITPEDQVFFGNTLEPGSTQSYTFYNITSSQVGVWHMYGLADCDSQVMETSENNNYIGPVTINWVNSGPDLIVQSLTVEDSSLITTEHTNGTITIKNRGSESVSSSFYTDVFKNRSSAPTPPATGQYNWQESSLPAGQTRTYNFYKLPHSTSSSTWKMWGLVDSRANITESNDTNNTYGPVYITWYDTFSYHQVNRADMINHALEFVDVNWTCSSANTSPHWSCPNDWRCRFSPGHNYTGEAYCWGGWDKPADFLTYLSANLCAGAVPDNIDSLCGQTDPYWATGVECAGLISRCWEFPLRRETQHLTNISDQIPIENLQPGDIMNKPYVHVRMFYQWLPPDSMKVIEATPPNCTISLYKTNDLVNDGYVPRRYRHVSDPGNNNPEIDTSIHCKYPLGECKECIKCNRRYTLEVNAHDDDGDPLMYVWESCWGNYIVNGNPVYQAACTTSENYIIYQAPSFSTYPDPYIPPEYLVVSVYDNRGGYTSSGDSFDVFDTSYSCRCGDTNHSKVIEIGDVVTLISYLFRNGPEPYLPKQRGDANNDCIIDIGDIIYLISYLYKNGPDTGCCWFH